jgi:hypothetical protein
VKLIYLDQCSKKNDGDDDDDGGDGDGDGDRVGISVYKLRPLATN